MYGYLKNEETAQSSFRHCTRADFEKVGGENFYDIHTRKFDDVLICDDSQNNNKFTYMNNDQVNDEVKSSKSTMNSCYKDPPHGITTCLPDADAEA